MHSGKWACGRIVLPVVVLLMLGLAAQAQKIKVEYDKNVDFSKFETYAFADEEGAVTHPVLRANIQGGIEEEMKKLGLQHVDSNPDLYVKFYSALNSDFAVSYSDFVYGPGGIPPFNQSFLMWGAIPGTTTTVMVHKGQLIIDLIETKPKKLVWRGEATDKLSEKREKALKQINTAVEKLLAKYPAK